MDGYEDLVRTDRLWVRLGEAWSADPDVRWRILGNAHTHRGRIQVQPIGTGEPYATVSLSDVVGCSAEARVWLNGFLAGQEAELSEFLGGRDPHDATPTELDRWRNWNRAWRRTGQAPALRKAPPADAVPVDLGPPTPWAYVAGAFLVHEDARWRLADPQPREFDPVASPGRDGWAWPGSICELRRHCSVRVDGAVTVCEDCHHITV